MFLADPPPTPYDLRFNLLRVPVRVHPMFWLVGLLFGMNSPNGVALIAWVAAFFLAILVHELGHALVMRAYGFWPWITLYGMGGMASYNPAMSRTPPFWGRIAISFAGPGMGFLMAVVVGAALYAAGRPLILAFPEVTSQIVVLERSIGAQVFPLLPGQTVGHGPQMLALWFGSPVAHFVNDFLFICVFWGAMNLLPIYPLDGGNIAREVFVRINPRDGLPHALMLSGAVAAMVAVAGFLRWNEPYIAIFFGYLAYMSFAMLASYRGR